MLQIIQPGLVGLDGRFVSTLADDGKTSGRGAPYSCAVLVCAGAGRSWRRSDAHNFADDFQVGAAASIGAGISDDFAEAGIGHTVPHLIPDFYKATIIAGWR